MAKEWTVTPSEGVVNNNDGTFSFPANDTFCDKTYIIEYKDTDDGCTCNAVFTQVGNSCEDVVTYGTGTDTGYHSLDCDGGSFMVEAYVPYTAQTKVISPDCTQCNNGQVVHDTVYKSASVYYDINTGSDIVNADDWTSLPDGGRIDYKYSQEGGCTPPTPPCCDDEITASGENYISGGTEGSGRIGTCGYLNTTCSKGTFTVSNVSSDASWLSGESFNPDDNTFEAYCEKNTTGSDRTAHLTATATCGGKTYPLSWSSTQCCCCGD
jgi:hypothetical protein